MKQAQIQHYRGYVIRYDPPPIPSRQYDWHYQHEEFDGAMDSRDFRFGSAGSVEQCKREIDELEDGGGG